MSVQSTYYIIQLLEVVFLCRRKKIPTIVLAVAGYVAFAFALTSSKRFYINRYIGYILSFGVALHYVMLIIVTVYILLWLLLHVKFANYLYGMQKYIIVVSLTLALAGFMNGMYIGLNTYEVHSDKVESDIRVVHLSDFHISNIFSQVEIDGLVNKINSLEPDIVCITGDMFTNRECTLIDMEAVYSELRRLNPKYGTYVCQGNHDVPLMDCVLELCEECGFSILLDDSVEINDVEIIGRACSTVKSKNLNNIVNNTDKFTIVLDHIPNRIDESVSNNIDLHLSGHTHGGQLPPISLKFKLEYGIYAGAKYFNDTFVVVNRGTYLIYPYCRLVDTSEVVCIDIKPK